MPKRNKLPRLSGAAIGKIAKPCWRCDNCGLLLRAEGSKPNDCQSCKHLNFTRFDSMGEAVRYAELLLLVRAGEISQLERQVRIELSTKNHVTGLVQRIGHYVADFRYIEKGKSVVEDFKGGITDLAHWKLRHVKAEYGIDVILTTEIR